MLLSVLQEFTTEPVTFFVLLGTAGLILFFMLAALSTPLFGAVTESLYVIKHTSFYDKCALQITQAAFGMGVFIFSTLGAWVFYYWEFEPLLFFVALLNGLIFLCAYWSTWSVLKQRRALHLLLGWSAALSMLGALLFGLYFFLPPFMPLVYLALICLGLVCTGLAAGAGLSQLWLIMRRFKADYGRDYYAFAMRYCARVALTFTLTAALAVGALLFLLRQFIPAQLMQTPDVGITIIAFGLPLSCCQLWLGITKSENPLRHKIGAFFACIFLFIALCAQLLILFSTFYLA